MTRPSFVTGQQATIHELFLKHRSMSMVAREVGVSQIRVREALVQYQRNILRDQGIRPPSLREMMLGDVVTRFCTPRENVGGRPAKHARFSLGVGDAASARARPDAGVPSSAAQNSPSLRRIDPPAVGTARYLLTSVEAGAEVHRGFWTNLQAYAARSGAELLVIRLGAVGVVGGGDARLRSLATTSRIDIGGLVDVVSGSRSSQSSRPLDSPSIPREARWTLVPHAAIQLETLARLRGDGLRVQMTTGAATVPRGRSRPDWRGELGAVMIEVRGDGHAHCRHLLASIDGDGAFHDLDRRVSDGRVTVGRPVAAIVFGDLHHAHLDAEVAAATWGVDGGVVDRVVPIVDRLRPRTMIFHDVCDFSARSHHDARDPHRRFALMSTGGECVRSEFRATAEFLAATRRTWSETVVVQSNHDAALVRWLREADFRQDPVNAEFFLECSLALYRRLAQDATGDGLFEQVVRGLSKDGLQQVRFLRTGEGLKIAGVECGIHGHSAADGKRGSMSAFEALGIRAILGHNHRPTTRGGICSAGVCQLDLAYARGPLTAWAVGHVVAHDDGARQHLIFEGGRFFA